MGNRYGDSKSTEMLIKPDVLKGTGIRHKLELENKLPFILLLNGFQ